MLSYIALYATLLEQIPCPRRTGETDAMALGSAVPGTYTECVHGRIPDWDPAVTYFGRVIIVRLRFSYMIGCLFSVGIVFFYILIVQIFQTP